VDVFRRFFEPLGDVTNSDTSVTFAAPRAGTGLDLSRDGASRSFVPLHDLTLEWEVVEFDHGANVVRLEAAGGVYVYRVPPSPLG